MADDKQHDNNSLQDSNNAHKADPQTTKPICGIIRPISAMGDYSEQHWKEVAEILNEPIIEAGFRPNLVSDAAEISIIQKIIIQNLYDYPIIICDISGKNANVMFELGLRLAFDKPTIIIKDETTGDSFDTAPIERLEYSRSLHYPSVVKFKKKLKEKILATMDKAEKDENYSPFLRNFGELVPAKISKQEVSQQQFWDKKIQGVEEKVDLVLRWLARQRQETEAGIWGGIQSDKEGVVWAPPRIAMPQGILAAGMKTSSEARRNSLLQKLRQAREELRLVNSAAAAASKQAKIERLEKALMQLEEDQE